MPADVDDIDRSILRELGKDARHNTNTEIGERVGVSASTVGKRIAALEDRAVIEGYVPVVDYEALGFPLRVVLVCTAPMGERAGVVSRIRAIDGVVSVRELMTGEANVHVQAVGTSNDDIGDVARAIGDLGVVVNDGILLRTESVQPTGHVDPTE